MTRFARRSFLVLIAVAPVFACSTNSGDPERRTPLGQVLQKVLDTISRKQDYRDPDAAEKAAARRAVGRLLAGDVGAATADQFRTAGFELDDVVDDGLRWEVATTAGNTAHPWGVFIAEAQSRVRWLIEVPHPLADQMTEWLGLELLRAAPGSALLVTGAHRDAANGRGDAAHNNDSMFHAIAKECAEQGIAQLQLHGFADDSLPNEDVVVSTGTTRAGPKPRAVADAIAAAGWRVCRAWEAECGKLEGTENALAKVSDNEGWTFIHLEVAARIRTDAGNRKRLVQVLAGVLAAP